MWCAVQMYIWQFMEILEAQQFEDCLAGVEGKCYAAVPLNNRLGLFHESINLKILRRYLFSIFDEDIWEGYKFGDIHLWDA